MFRCFQTKRKDHIHEHDDGFPLRDLPNDILTNILSKLPLRCILNLQTVCKKWLVLTSSPQFAQIHFKGGANTQISKDNELDLFLFDEEAEKYKLVKIMPNGFIKVTADVSPILVGSFNGLLVFQMSLGSRYLVWDLTTREYTYIDSPASFRPLSLSAILSHSSIQKYKLLFSKKTSDSPDQYEFFVYESTDNTWRKLSHSSYPPMSSIDQAVVNPTIYKNFVLWMAPSDMPLNHIPECRSSVVIFDMVVENFRSLPHPGIECSSSRGAHKNMYFFELKGGLYFCYYDLGIKGVAIWSLEFYDSWYFMKRHEVKLDHLKKTISSMYFPCDRLWFNTVKLVKIEGDTMLFRCQNRGLFAYNWKKKIVWKLDKAWKNYSALLSPTSISGSNKFTYSDSSLSLKSGFRCRKSRGRIHGAAREYHC